MKISLHKIEAGDNNHASTNSNKIEITEEQRKIFNEEPKSTTNVMKAVMNYDPQDDKRICPFYDHKTGRCFKTFCRLEHVPKLLGIWYMNIVFFFYEIEV